MKEHWKYVVGYEPLYAVSTHGRVFSLRKALILKPRAKRRTNKKQQRSSDMYPFVELGDNGKHKRKRFAVHTLVLTAFRGPRLDGQECRHLDGNPLNNNLANLKWGSYHENRLDYHKHRKRIKLTPDVVRYIRNSTKSYRQLARELGVTKTTIQYAKGYWRLEEIEDKLESDVDDELAKLAKNSG